MSQYNGRGTHQHHRSQSRHHEQSGLTPSQTVYDEYDGHDAYYDDTAGSVAPWTPGLSRRRRHSSVSARSLGRGASMRMSSTVAVKFRRKGGFRSGITLGEAMASVRLSGNDSYTFHDLNVDSRGRIILKIRVSPRVLSGVNEAYAMGS